MKILINIGLIAINLCSSSHAIENQITLSNGDHGIDSDITSNVTTSMQSYESYLEAPDTSELNSIETEYLRIASLFETEDIRFCMQPRSNAIPPVRIVTKPCGDSDGQLFYVDVYGFLRWSLNHNMCLMRFATPANKAVLVLDNCENSKFQEKLLYSSFDGAIVIGRKSANLRAATFEGTVPKRNIVIQMKKRDYNSSGQLWKIEHVSSSSVAPTGEPTTVAPTGEPTAVAPTGEPTTVAPTGEPTAVAPTGEPTTVAPTGEPTAVAPTGEPTTVAPTGEPTTVAPTGEPSKVAPTGEPTAVAPTGEPTALRPTIAPTTNVPTVEPTLKRTDEPSVAPTSTPSAEPSGAPSTVRFP